MATSDQILTLAQVIWPDAKNIQVAPFKAGRSAWSGSTDKEGFKLTISADDGSLVAQISAGNLNALKEKLEQRTRKRNWGSF